MVNMATHGKGNNHSNTMDTIFILACAVCIYQRKETETKVFWFLKLEEWWGCSLTSWVGVYIYWGGNGERGISYEHYIQSGEGILSPSEWWYRQLDTLYSIHFLFFIIIYIVLEIRVSTFASLSKFFIIVRLLNTLYNIFAVECPWWSYY